MNIKPKTAVLAILALSTIGLATAKAPEIDPARIDSMVAEVLRQADQHPNQTAKPDGQAIRKDVVKRLQTLEILKNEAIKAGLDKDAEVQNQLKNVEAEFYANQYAAYLERQTAVDDAIKAHEPKKLLNLNEFVDILPASGDDDHDHGDEHDHEHEANDGGGDDHAHEHDDHDHDDHDHGGHHHDHGGIDPHFWQDPHRMIKAAKALADALSDIDSEHAEDYAKNYEALEKELTDLDEELHQKYESVDREKAFITSHTAFAYLADTYDLHQIGIAGIDPENEPSTERLLELAELVKKEKLTTVFFETSATPAVAEALASRTGAKAEELDNLETQLDAKKDYAQVMRENADKLVASWQ